MLICSTIIYLWLCIRNSAKVLDIERWKIPGPNQKELIAELGRQKSKLVMTRRLDVCFHVGEQR